MNWQAPDVILRAFLCMCIIIISISKIIVIQLEYWESDIHHENLLMLWLNHLFLIYMLYFMWPPFHQLPLSYFLFLLFPMRRHWLNIWFIIIDTPLHAFIIDSSACSYRRVALDRNTQCNKYLDCRILNKTMSIQCNTFCHKYIWKFSLAKI